MKSIVTEAYIRPFNSTPILNIDWTNVPFYPNVRILQSVVMNIHIEY